MPEPTPATPTSQPPNSGPAVRCVFELPLNRAQSRAIEQAWAEHGLAGSAIMCQPVRNGHSGGRAYRALQVAILAPELSAQINATLAAATAAVGETPPATSTICCNPSPVGFRERPDPDTDPQPPALPAASGQGLSSHPSR